MTATITAVPEPLNNPPRVKITVAGMPTGDPSVRITRNDSAGNITVVRSGDPATLVAGGWVGYDYEAPFGGSYYYIAVSDPTAVDVNTPAAVTLDPQEPWLIHPGIPSLSQPITLERRGDRTRPVVQGAHSVLGRDTPIVITDGARKAPTFDLMLWTRTLADESAMWDLLADTSPLLLQVSYPNVARTGYDWVAVGDVTTSDLIDFYGNTYVRWSLPCTVTSPPTGLLQSEWTWAGLVSHYGTWQDVVNHYTTWADVVTNSPH